MAKISVDGLEDAIMKELLEYSQEVTDQLKEDVKTVAKECADEIRANSPSDSGKYAKGWNAKVVYESKDDIRVIVHNSKKPGLPHLLEYGHAKVNGGRVDGKAHIRPAEQNAEKKLFGKVKVAVR